MMYKFVVYTHTKKNLNTKQDVWKVGRMIVPYVSCFLVRFEIPGLDFRSSDLNRRGSDLVLDQIIIK